MLGELAPSLITRTRAREVYNKLAEYLHADQIELDLNTKGLISLSFLDEVVLKLVQGGQLRQVVFNVTNSSVQEKLKQIAYVRNVSFPIRLRLDSDPTLIEPKTPESIVVRDPHTERQSKITQTLSKAR